jgi:glucose-1-phosphate thymidylyltransferase
MKGIVLAGGSGTRLHPITKGVSKQLLPVYDKPMIYYPLSVLMLAGIQDILIITTPEDHDAFIRLLGDGSQFGVKLTFALQDKPDGLASAFVIGESFIGTDNVCLVLGDNLFWGAGFAQLLQKAVLRETGATVFAYQVDNPTAFGVVEFDSKFKAISIEEKPKNPKSNYAVTGLYFYDNAVIDYAKAVNRSARGEYEITTINNDYLREGKLTVEVLGRGHAWLDTGTHENLLSSGLFVETIESRQGYKIACLEEIAFNKGWMTKNEVSAVADTMSNNSYGRYLKKLVGDS